MVPPWQGGMKTGKPISVLAICFASWPSQYTDLCSQSFPGVGSNSVGSPPSGPIGFSGFCGPTFGRYGPPWPGPLGWKYHGAANTNQGPPPPTVLMVSQYPGSMGPYVVSPSTVILVCPGCSHC